MDGMKELFGVMDKKPSEGFVWEKRVSHAVLIKKDQNLTLIRQW